MNAYPQDSSPNDIDSSPNSSQGTLKVEGAPNWLAGLTFVITGVLPNLSREDAQNLIKQFGGRPTTSLSRKTNYGVFGNDPGWKKLETIGELSLETIDEVELLGMVRTRLPPSETTEDEQSRAKKRARKDSKVGAPSTASSSLASSQYALLSSPDSIASSQPSTYSSHFSSPSQTLLPSSQPFAASSSQNTIISVSSSQDSNTSTTTTKIYNTLYFLRQKLGQLLLLTPKKLLQMISSRAWRGYVLLPGERSRIWGEGVLRRW